MKAVIMAGGKGTRLFSLTLDEIPKPMVKILGKPILEHQIENLKKQGITDFIISVGHLKEHIKNYFKNGKDFGVKIEYIEESMPLGSGGSLYYLKDKIKGDFLCLSGDTLFDINVDRMYQFHKKNKADASLFVHPNSHPFDSDIMICDKNYKISALLRKNSERNFYYSNLVNAGFIILNAQTLSYFDEIKKVNLEHDFINYLIENNQRVFAYKSTEYIKDIGTPERLANAEKDLLNGIVSRKNLANKQKCVFLDRDGTINKYKGFIRNCEGIELIEDIEKAISLLNKSEYLVMIVTNQPVIARGEASFEEVENMHKKIEMLLGESGVYIDEFAYCPHHPHSGFQGEIKELKIECECRKPKTGLVERLAIEYNIDLKDSYFIGDTGTDVLTGMNCGMKTIKVKSDAEDKFADIIPDYYANSVFEAVNKIILNI